jgi:hypothetical protein
MTSPSRRCQAALLLTLTLLTTSGAWAASGPAGRKNEHPAVVKPASASLLGRAWNLLTALWDKEGCGIDPDGRCIAPAPVVPAQADTGCGIDPNGRCNS